MKVLPKIVGFLALSTKARRGLRETSAYPQGALTVFSQTLILALALLIKARRGLRGNCAAGSPFFLALALMSMSAYGEISAPGGYETLKQNTELQVRNKISPLLTKYCPDVCQLLSVDVNVDEQITDNSEIGFEGLDMVEQTHMAIEKIIINLQVDRRVTLKNRERLHSIILNNVKDFSAPTDLVWVPVELPEIGQTISVQEEIKSQLKKEVENALNRVVQNYCPETCLISHVHVSGELITADEASSLKSEEVYRGKPSEAYIHVQNVDVAISMDTKINPSTQKKIMSMLKAATNFVSPVYFTLDASEFPLTYEKQREQQMAESQDPYGLDKLRHMLTLFKELAGTKEIISHSDSSEKQTAQSTNQSKESSASSKSSSESQTEGETKWPLYALALIIVAGFMTMMVLRVGKAKSDARVMIDTYKRNQAPQSMMGGPLPVKEDPKSPVSKEEYELRLKIQQMKDDLVKIFVQCPLVAKETFSKLLLEGGVEETAKYVHIFGKMIIFELLSDPNLHRGLHELSEFYHKSDFKFTFQDEESLLIILKKKVLANEIKVLTGHTNNQFDFLGRLDPVQIFSLIKDENPQVQCIVLTQLVPKKRRLVFDAFSGDLKSKLLTELSKADAIPKEYMFNVAKALARKVISKPEFDTENVRATDILIDLLEQSTLEQQRALMSGLNESNPDSARALKMKLVSIEMLPFMKDGHLLELMLGFEQEEVVQFLMGAPAHIARLIMSKAPEELSASWREELQYAAGADEARYDLVEKKVLSKIRVLANGGAISLLAINEMIFNVKTSKFKSGEKEVVLKKPTEFVA